MRIFSTLVIIFFTNALVFGQSGASLYSDIKAHSVGEVITVLIIENASAKQSSSDKSRSNAAVNADASLAGTFAEFLPVFGASSAISSDIDNSNGSDQQDRLSGKISVMIVGKTEMGLLEIQGERSVQVNGEENIMKLEGMVRPRDIRTDNTIFSYNIANAEIVYRQAGVVNSIASPNAASKTIAFTLVLGLIGYALLGPGI